jgi:formiminotetrahydrofolate cyclodeaminase
VTHDPDPLPGKVMARSGSDLPSVDKFVNSVAADEVRASAGAVAALAVALAADLAAQVALASADWGERGGALAQADAIRARAIALATEVGCAYEVVLTALTQTLATPPVPANVDLGEALGRAVEPLLAIAEAAGDAAELAEHVARSGATLVRADAVAATMLATTAAEIAQHLVAVNLLVTGDDDRSQRARELFAAAAERREAARALQR